MIFPTDNDARIRNESQNGRCYPLPLPPLPVLLPPAAAAYAAAAEQKAVFCSREFAAIVQTFLLSPIASHLI